MPNNVLTKTNSQLDFVEVEIGPDWKHSSSFGIDNAGFCPEPTTSGKNGAATGETSDRVSQADTQKLEEESPARKSRKYIIPHSFVTIWKFSWGNWFVTFLRNYKQVIQEDSINVSPGKAALSNSISFMELWTKESQKKKKNKVSVVYLLLRFITPSLITQMILALAALGLSLISVISIFPLVLHYLTLEYGPSPNIAALLCVIVMLIEVFRAYFAKWLSDWMTVSATKVTGALSDLFLKKTLTLRSDSSRQLANQYKTFTRVISTIIFHLPLLLTIPLHLLLIFIFSGAILGPWAFLGSIIMFTFIPIQILLEYNYVQYSMKAALFSKERVRIFQSAMQNIKFVKMFAWENIFQRKILVYRYAELQVNFWRALCRLFIIFISPFVPIFAYTISFICHAMTGGMMTPASVFGVVALFNTFNITSFIINHLLQQFLKVPCLPAKIKSIVNIENGPENEVNPESNYPIIISDATFAVGSSQVSENEFDQDDDSLISILSHVNLKIAKGKLIGICGAPESGKEALFFGLFGDAKIVSGSVNVCGSLAYVPKDTWILDDSLRENIIMGKSMNHNWYEEVLTLCSLRDDVQSLPLGDMTNIKDPTVSLDESQCYRIGIARAIYSKSDIYLFDNPLFGLDVTFSREFFQKIIQTILQEKTVLISSNQVQYLQDCDEILLIKDGLIKEIGNHPELILRSPEYASLAAKQIMADDIEKSEETRNGLNNKVVLIPDGAILDHSKSSANQNSYQIVKTLRAFAIFLGSSHFLWPLLILFLTISHQIFVTFISSWLGLWLQDFEGKNESINGTLIQYTPVQNSYYCLVLGLICFAAFVTCCLLIFTFAKFMKSSSTNTHNSMLSKIFQKKMEFFEETALPDIIDRFSKDLDKWDSTIAFLTAIFLSRFLYILGGLMQFVIAQKIVLSIILPGAFLFFFLHQKLCGVIRILKTNKSNFRLKMVNDISSFAKGVGSIRAYELQKLFIKRFHNDLDKSNAWVSMFKFGMNLSLFSQIIFLFFVYSFSGLILILRGSTAPEVGIVLSSGLQIIILFQHFILAKLAYDGQSPRIFNIKEFLSDYLIERDSEVLHQIPKNWPQEGSIVLSNVKMSYSSNQPLVYKGLTFAIAPGEKIGIIGNSGSGKSSLISVLLRLVDISEGIILIDGIDINNITLSNLRSCLTVLTSNTILFPGTIRYNLDPLGKFSDEEIWEALKKVHLHERISEEIKALDTFINPSSMNFTHGERQQLGLAQAVLQNNKILILDNFTDFVDPVSEAILLDVVNLHFISCTILTISRNINIILQNKRVMVLQYGQIIEFETPSVLLSQESHLRQILDKAALSFPVHQT